ncbi:MAG: alpha/beta fold hydrolase [Planctomycetota bacterium]|jgi:alpha-beta hydrolase superfamily lysophospholipase
MNHFESIRIFLSDKYEVFARLWMPSQPRGAVLYLHGIQSHGGWFETSAQRLAEAGFAVLLPDRRGSGRNNHQRGHLPSTRQLMRDIAEFLDELHVRTHFSQAHVIGVSWGGKLALAATQQMPQKIRSLTLVAPGLFPKVDISLTQKLRVALSAVMARKSLFDIPLNEPELFTANPVRQQFIRDDSLALHRVTAAFLLTSRKLDQYARSAAGNTKGCPLRVFLAGKDKIIDNAKTKDLVRRLNWSTREITEYSDAGHTLEFEADPQPYLNDLIEWINAS